MSVSQSTAVTRHQEVTRFLQVGDLKSAATVCARLNADFPQFSPGWHSASFIALCLGEIGSATQMIQRALSGAPTDPRNLLQYARCLFAQRRVTGSLDAAASAENLALKDAALLDAIGTFYSSAGEQQRAFAAYSRAIDLDAGQAVFFFNRATVRRFLG